MSTIYMMLNKVSELLNLLNSLKSIQTEKISIVFKEEGMFLLASSTSRLITAEGYLRNLQFGVYRLVRDTEICVDFQVLRQILKSFTKTSLNATISMEYPVRDNKLLIYQEDESGAAQFYLDTFITEIENNLSLSGDIVASVKFKDSKILKHALDLITHGKSDSEVYLTFNTSRPMLYFTRDDQINNVKSKVSIPFVEGVESKVKKQMEKTYHAKVLRGISNFPKCNMIELKMHEEGVLQVEVSISTGDEILIRHFINPCEVYEVS